MTLSGADLPPRTSTFGEHLLWLALLLIAIEFIYANTLARGSKGGEVRVDAAGHVEKHKLVEV